MKLSLVIRQAARVYGKNWFQGALCVLLQLVLRLMVAAPLLFLVTTEVPWLALLCIPMYLLIIPPARQNMAAAMEDAVNGGPLFSAKLVSMENYGRKFCQGLKMTGLMMLWALPLLAATGVAVWVYKGEIPITIPLNFLINLGGGSFETGIRNVALIYASTLIPVVLGMAFHSGTRYALALGGRKVLRGRRLGVIAVWVVGLLALAPFAAAVGTVCSGFVSALLDTLKTFDLSNLTLPSLKESAVVLGGAFAVLFLPMMPFKQLMTAVYVRGQKA